MLAALLIGGPMYQPLHHALFSEVFADPIHGGLFLSLKAIADYPIEDRAREVATRMGRELDEVGGADYVEALARLPLVTIEEFGDHARTLRSCWARRWLLEAGEQVQEIGAEMAQAAIDIAGSAAPERMIDHLRSRLEKVAAELRAASYHSGGLG